MAADDQRQEIIDWLKQRNHSPSEVEQIMHRLDAYDASAVRASIFDSADAGQFDIEAIIRQVTEADDAGEG